MKKHTEKPPIDDLFARKLGNMSLPPSPDGFRRLQARMGQSMQPTPVVFWRNPVIQRCMAVAACLLLICLFGWLYWPPNSQPTDETQVATNQSVRSNPHTPIQKSINPEQHITTPDQEISDVVTQKRTDIQLTQVEKIADRKKKEDNKSTNQPEASTEPFLKTRPSADNEPVLAQTKPVEGKNKPTATHADGGLPVNSVSINQIAANQSSTKPASPAERVLLVTIAEPEALVAARQSAVSNVSVEEKSVVAINDQSEEKTEAGGLWQQMKRIKQGEVFARRDNPGNDERGLLGRAYNGLKQSFEKDKPAKQ